MEDELHGFGSGSVVFAHKLRVDGCEAGFAERTSILNLGSGEST